VRDHAAAKIEVLPVTGLPEFRPGDDLTGAIADAARWLRSGDVVVVTSKVVSKVEGRLVRVPDDPEERDRIRRRLVFSESVQILARKNRTLITENKLGIVQAASGIDASNVAGDELALLPADPDASALALRRGLRDRLGVEVAVVVTDTMGRTWRIGQTDVAIGASGMRVLHSYAGAVDRQGNELAVTEIAVADEVAAAADLVKGKLGALPVAVVRGLSIGDETARAADLVRPAEEDLFRLGTAEAIAQGRRDAIALLSWRPRFRDEPVDEPALARAVAVALAAGDDRDAIRVVHLADPARRKRVLHELEPAPGYQELVERLQALHRAPGILLVLRIPHARDGRGNRTVSDAIVEQLRAALAAEGIGTSWISREGAQLTEPLGLPPSVVLGVLAFGYPAELPHPDAESDERFLRR
jgi:dehydro coenzyme F420 reductase / coenzyme F420-0:L-glutamate ligase / coenzyme F420-1:gamma-L-glutamate ligase